MGEEIMMMCDGSSELVRVCSLCDDRWFLLSHAQMSHVFGITGGKFRKRVLLTTGWNIY